MRIFDVEGQPLNLNSTSSAPIGPSEPLPANGSQRYEKAQAWKPSKTVLWGSVAGILVVAILSFGLVFGIPHSSNSTSGSITTPTPSGTQLPTSIDEASVGCDQLALSKFWTYLTPEQYDISIDLANGNNFNYDPSIPGFGLSNAFAATTSITFNILKSTSCIILNAENITFSDISIQTTPASDPIDLCNDISSCNTVASPIFRSNPPISTIDSNLTAINLGNHNLTTGATAIITFAYTGYIGPTPNVLGLHYSSPFTDCTQGNTCVGKVLVSSQSERTGARRIFPCYDMPSMKAIFNMKVAVPTQQGNIPVVLSNTKEISRNKNDDGTAVVVSFAPTPKMSTYLLGITAGDLLETTPISNKDASRYEVRGWAVPGREGLMQNATQYGERALAYYEDYFGIEQPLKKFDMVAVPGRSFAMEDWGMPLFDESRILYNATSASAYNLEQLASVVCHEFGHQWIGNLATLPVWDELVINEGLVSLQEYQCMEALAPELSANSLRSRLYTPLQFKPSPHDGIVSAALYFASDPLIPALIPESDLVFTNTTAAERNVYSKGGTAFLLIKTALDNALSALAPQLWQRVLQKAIKDNEFASLSLYGLFSALYSVVQQEYDAKVGPGKQYPSYAQAAIFLDRIQVFLSSNGDPVVMREMGLNGSSVVGTWYYTGAYPLLHPDEDGIFQSNNLTLSLYNIVANQSRYCSWTMTDAQQKENNATANQRLRMYNACQNPARFAAVLQISNFSSCAAINGPKDSFIPSVTAPMDYGPVQENGWVPNIDANRLWRTEYSAEHLDTLINLMDTLVPCDGYSPQAQQAALTAANAPANCCSPVGDAIKASAVVNDLAAFLSRGMTDASSTMDAIQKSGTSPMTYSGNGQYFMLLQDMEILEVLRTYIADDNPSCADLLDAFTLQLVQPQINDIFSNIDTMYVPLVPEDFIRDNGGSGSAALLSTTAKVQSDFLGRLAGAQLLRRAAVIPGSTLNIDNVIPSPYAFGVVGANTTTTNINTTTTTTNTTTNINTTTTTTTTTPGAPAVAPISNPIADPNTNTAAAPAAFSPDTTTAAAPPPTATANNTTTAGGEGGGRRRRRLHLRDILQKTAPAAAAATTTQTAATTPTSPIITSGNTTLQRDLCAMLPYTPLWNDYIDVNGTSQQTASVTSPDLLPTIYSVAAAMPAGCLEALQDLLAGVESSTGNTTDTNDPGYIVRRALINCWYYNPSLDSATACLYASINSPTPVLALMAQSVPTETTSLTDRLRYTERRQLQQDTSTWTLYLGTRLRATGWISLMQLLQTQPGWDVITTPAACSTLALVRAPITAAEKESLQQVMNGNGKQCSQDVVEQVYGKMATADEFGPAVATGVCEYLSARKNSLLTK